MIKCVIFDLDETLFDRHQTLTTFLAGQYDRFRADLGAADKSDWIETFMRMDDRGKTPKRDLYPSLLKEFDGRIEASAALIDDYYARSVTNAIAMDGLAVMLNDLQARQITTAIITNGETKLQTQTLHALGLLDRVSLVLISEEENCRKPEPEIFQRALQRLGLDAVNCLFVGDDAMSDVLGAHRVGMQTAWFNRDDRSWPQDIDENPGVEIHHLSQLSTLLDQVS